MAGFKFELNLPGLNALMKSPEMQAVLDKAGADMAGRASDMAEGEPFRHKTKTLNWIAVTNVAPDSIEAAQANLDENILLKALGSTKI